MTTETPLEHRLRNDLRARQSEAPHAPADLADRVRRRHRGQRRAQLLTAVAAIAVVAVFAGASSLLQRPATSPDADSAARPSLTPVPTITEWPTRGSLAGDDEWVDAVRALDWEIPTELFAELPDPPLQERHVVFAGDVPDGRVALVVGDDDGRLGAAWFTGPEGAEAAEMEVVDLPQRVNRTSPQALVRATSPDARAVLLVAVGPPGASMDVTAPPVVDSAGTETLPRVELPTEDGVAVYDLQNSWSMASQVRSRVDDRMPYTILPTVTFTDDAGLTDPSRPVAEVTEELILEETIDRVLAEYGMTEEQLRPVVLASGGGNGNERLVLFGMTFPSDATGVWLLSYERDRQGWNSTLGRLPHAPAGTALGDRLVSVPSDGVRIVIAAPGGAVRAQVLSDEGEELGSVDLVDGGYVGPVPGGAFAPSTNGAATVRALDASGAVVAEEPIGRLVTGP